MPSFSGKPYNFKDTSMAEYRHFIDPVRVGPPRLDPYQKLICRFYEPLFLLATLRQTRGEHTAKPPNLGPEQAQRRSFLRNLAYICDFKKGGESCTAIGLEESNTCYNFWVACNNHCLQVTKFLETVLHKLEVFSHHNCQDLEAEKVAFVEFSVDFAVARTKEEILCLHKAVKECYSAIGDMQLHQCERLQHWIKLAPDQRKYVEFCHYVHKNRDSDFINILSCQAKQEERRRGPEAKRSSFASVNHYIGRLANRIEAPQQLILDAPYLGHLLGSYKVCSIEKVQPILPPLRDTHTTMGGILNRMLKKDDPERSEIEESLLYRNNQSNLFKRFLQQYKKCSPLVHAEIQVLEFFHRTNLSFVAGDRYVACSKPACLCCQMYFRYHPARMVIPESHCKIWTNWAPPLVAHFAKNDPESERQRYILNQMTGEIRHTAIADILGHSPARKWHHDSQTEFSGDWCFNITSENPWDSKTDNTSADWESKDSSVVALGTSSQAVERLDEDYQSEDGGVRIVN